MQIIKGTGREKIPTSLNPNGEFLLTLMRLQLGQLNENVRYGLIYRPQNTYLFLQLG